MHLKQRLDLSARLGEYMLSGDMAWQAAKEKAYRQNNWFIPEFIDIATHNIARNYLQKDELAAWVARYPVPAENDHIKNTGIVMAGNIPLVGFHDFLCAFISGHRQTIKTSSKDEVLITHLAEFLYGQDNEAREYISFSGMLKGCDAYIATGSNNSARYFDYYFGKYPHIIRRNRTSVAVLTGDETPEDLDRLADDVYLYFGLGCRNVTKIYVPHNYDFIPLLEAFKKYNYLADHYKYKNNYDYILAIALLNKNFYMTNGSVLLLENPALFSPISQLNYEYYSDSGAVTAFLAHHEDVQCITGRQGIPFGQAQQPGLTDYADGIDTLQFLLEI